MVIGTRIRELRKREGITQENLADYLGISYQAVSKWELGTALPDITLVPSIASFFGVTIDYLFAQDTVESEEERSILQENDKLKAAHKTLESIRLLKKALQKYPHNYTIMLALSTSLYMSQSHDEAEQAVVLCEKILHNCTNTDIRYPAIQILCLAYCSLGRLDDASELIKVLPNTPICRDILLEKVLQGEALEKQLDSNLEHFMFYIWLKLQKTAKKDSELAFEDKIRAQTAALQLYQTVYYDGKYGWYANRIAMNYLNLAILFAGKKDEENTLKSLLSAILYAREYRASFSVKIDTHSIFRHQSCLCSDVGEAEKEALLMQIDNVIRSEAFNFLKSNEKFLEILADMDTEKGNGYE